MTPSLVVLGNLLVDDLVFADGSIRMGQPGGAILYGALGARLWGTRTGCVSLQGDDYPIAVLDELRQRGIDLAGVHGLGREGIRTWLLYEGPVRRVVHRLGGPTHEDVSPGVGHIPAGWRAARAFHLAPMPFAVQQALVTSLAWQKDGFVSVDPHLPISDETLVDWRRMLAAADAFFPSEDELLIERAQTDPETLLPQLVSGRLRFVVFKRGVKGGILYDARERQFHRWTARVTAVPDPTGAGDAFAMGFVSAHLEGLPVHACLQRAVVTASFAIEAWGPDALLSASPAAADARLRHWFGEEVAR